MAIVQEYLVRYHFESGGKRASPDYSDAVQLSTQTTDPNGTHRTSSPMYDAISTILSNNNKLQAGKTLVIDGSTALHNTTDPLA